MQSDLAESPLIRVWVCYPEATQWGREALVLRQQVKANSSSEGSYKVQLHDNSPWGWWESYDYAKRSIFKGCPRLLWKGWSWEVDLTNSIIKIRFCWSSTLRATQINSGKTFAIKSQWPPYFKLSREVLFDGQVQKLHVEWTYYSLLLPATKRISDNVHRVPAVWSSWPGLSRPRNSESRMKSHQARFKDLCCSSALHSMQRLQRSWRLPKTQKYQRITLFWPPPSCLLRLFGAERVCRLPEELRREWLPARASFEASRCCCKDGTHDGPRRVCLRLDSAAGACPHTDILPAVWAQVAWGWKVSEERRRL